MSAISQENGVCTRCATIVNHYAIADLLRRVHLLCQKFRKGVGGQREVVGAKKPFKPQRFRPLFGTLFPVPPLGEWGHVSGELLGSFLGGLFVAFLVKSACS